jgi:hypothetical protein
VPHRQIGFLVTTVNVLVGNPIPRLTPENGSILKPLR